MTDGVTERRALIAAWCGRGRRLGYALYALAVVVFFVGLAIGFGHGIAAIIVTAMAVGACALVPAIVFGYGVRAAERDERDA